MSASIYIGFTAKSVDPRDRFSRKHGERMAHYTVHVAESDMAMGSASPLSAIEAYYKVRELRAMGFKMVSLRNVDTDEEIVDIDSLVRDSPDA